MALQFFLSSCADIAKVIHSCIHLKAISTSKAPFLQPKQKMCLGLFVLIRMGFEDNYFQPSYETVSLLPIANVHSIHQRKSFTESVALIVV